GRCGCEDVMADCVRGDRFGGNRDPPGQSGPDLQSTSSVMEGQWLPGFWSCLTDAASPPVGQPTMPSFGQSPTNWKCPRRLSCGNGCSASSRAPPTRNTWDTARHIAWRTVN